jgi:tRNA-specific 2-thiouridylase
MSGGVDSSVAAALLVEQGYDVSGVMLKLWRGEAANGDSGCCNVGAADDARRVADALGIAFYVLNFAERFENTVVQDFRASYGGGTTPNPCVRCNQWIKFDALLERAEALGADVLATGHYARVVETNGRLHLHRGVDSNKDQSYVLWMLDQDKLRRCRFPVGDLEKKQTRRIAQELGLRTAAKPDSQEICFVRGGDLGAYVDEHIAGAAREGEIVDASGRVVGRHSGVARYTVGQRKGLGISLGVPVYVTSIDAGANRVVVGSRDDLSVARFIAKEVSFVGEPVRDGDRVLVQHRAHGDATPATFCRVAGDRADVRFVQGVEAVAPGQTAAFYSVETPDELVGGGIIESTVATAAVA